MKQKSVDTKTYIKEYYAYRDAKKRCNTKTDRRYSDYGGRGIKFLFSSFAEFFDCLGPAPTGYSIDRIDNNSHYMRGNVRWTTRSKQQQNKRVPKNNKYGIIGVVQHNGKELVTETFVAHIKRKGRMIHLYCGPDFFEACCARKSMEHKLTTYE